MDSMAIHPPAELFGTDLWLLPDVLRENSRFPGADLRCVQRPERAAADGEPPVDLGVVAGVDNLAQALLLRLLTPFGALAHLGHPGYGCRLHELIGELNNETSRNRAKMYVLQALADEPRVKEVTSVSVTPSPRDPAEVDVRVALLTIGEPVPLNLVFPFSLAAGPR
jgi:phage baseplate assembly protein W